jgi:hypothetical protein
MCEKIIHYNIVPTQYEKNCQVTIDKQCNGFVAKNTGNTLLTIMGEALQPGQSKSIGGNRAELFIGRVDLFFTGASLIPAQPVAKNACVVTQKVYTDLL